MTRPDQLAPVIANATSNVRTTPVRPGAVAYQDADGNFVEGCRKCGGSGSFRGLGPCFACKGKGKKKFKQPADQRAKNRTSVRMATARREENNVAEFAAAHPIEWAYIEANKRRWQMLASYRGNIVKKGELSVAQLAVIAKAIDRDASYQVQREERAAAAPAADAAGVLRLHEAFDRATAIATEKGRRFSPRLTIGGLTISPAKATSANPGALYVKQDGSYLGKIVKGKFLAVGIATAEQTERVLDFVKSPKEAATKYGIESGICCICNAKLTAEESMTRGMGPVCAANFGW